jgi:NIPSNAP
MTAKLMLRALFVPLIAAFSVFSAGVSMAQSNDAGDRVYELRTYTTLPGRLPALNKRFADHTIRLFARHGIKSVAYWIPTDDARKDNTLIYILSHDSQEAADKNWKEFQADPEWIKAREASEADGKILAKPPERIFMKMTDYSPGK